jgi:hypothetical protein
MAQYIFKVKRNDNQTAEILSELLNCASDPVLQQGATFATYYSNASWVISLAETSPPKPWLQHIDMDASGSGSSGSTDNACESGPIANNSENATGLLNRANAGVNPTITVDSNCGDSDCGRFDVVSQDVAYLNGPDGLSGPLIASVDNIIHYFEVTTSAIIKAGAWVRNDATIGGDPPEQQQIAAVVKTGYSAPNYTYRCYFMNIDGGAPAVTGAGDHIDLSAGNTLSFWTSYSSGSLQNKLTDNITPSVKQLAAYSVSSSFKSVHRFPTANIGSKTPVTTAGRDLANRVGIKPDGGSFTAGSNNAFAESASNLNVAAQSAWIPDMGSGTNWTVEDTVEISIIGGGQSGDWAVEVSGTATHGTGDSGSANVDWSNVSAMPTFYLGYYQDYAWAYAATAPPACAAAITTTVAQSAINSSASVPAGAQITAQVDSATCLPVLSNEATNSEVKVDFVKASSVISSVILKRTTAQWGSAVTGFNKTDLDSDDGNVNSPGGYVQWTLNWYANTGTTASPTWGSAIRTETINVNTGPALLSTIALGTGGEVCGINITLTSATASLGTTLRAVLFIDADGNKTLGGGENVVQGAKVGGSVVNFASSGVDFTISSLPTTVYVDLNDATNISGEEDFIVEWQWLNQVQNPDVWQPVDTIGFTLNSGSGNSTSYPSSNTHQTMAVNNCNPCANNTAAVYYFNVASGVINTTNGSGPATRGIKACSNNAFAAFIGGFCQQSWSVLGKSGGSPWASSALACGAPSSEATTIAIKLNGSHQDNGLPLNVYLSNGTTPLPDGWYIVCDPSISSGILQTPASNDDPCGGATHAFEIDAAGKIVSQSGGNAATVYNNGASAGEWGASGNVCYSGTASGAGGYAVSRLWKQCNPIFIR